VLASRDVLGSSFPISSKDFCNYCALAKSHRLAFTSSEHLAMTPFELIHSDVWMSPVVSVSGFRYYVLFTDDYTRYTWIYPMRKKSEVFNHFNNFITFIFNQFSTMVKILQSDGGKEYDNLSFRQLCAHKGIHHRFSCPHTPQQNGLAERKHRHISEMGRTMLLAASLPHKFWAEALCTAVYIINRLPTPVLKWASPFQILFGRAPDYMFLRTFGCACFPYLGDYATNKLQPRSLSCVFLGCSDKYKGYRCFHPPTGRVYLARHVTFNEDDFPFHFSMASSSVPQSDLVFVPIVPIPAPPQPHHALSPMLPLMQPVTLPQNLAASFPAAIQQQNMHAPPVTMPSPPHTSPLPVGGVEPLLPAPPVTMPQNMELVAVHTSAPLPTSIPTATQLHQSHPHTSHLPASGVAHAPSSGPHTRSKSGIFKPKTKAYFASRHPIPSAMTALVASDAEPTCFTQASRSPQWRKAMLDEFNALLKQGTWTLIPPVPYANIVGCKWVFKIKRHSDGSIERYKARLVAKGFHQQPGVDYTETFSPVVKPTTIRTVLSLAVSFGWPIHQLDVKNAFLHGSLMEEVYMAQPPGFVDPSRPKYVCKLRKAIYGLKQAPRAWFQRLNTFLMQVGFVQSRADSSMFTYHHGSTILVFLLYVDDIVLTGNSSPFIQSFIHTLSTEFELKDLGKLHYFLGIEVSYLSNGIHLSQNKYTLELLQRGDLLECKPCSTPIAAKTQLSAHTGAPLSDPSLYR
jgi:hypothetical protein